MKLETIQPTHSILGTTSGSWGLTFLALVVLGLIIGSLWLLKMLIQAKLMHADASRYAQAQIATAERYGQILEVQGDLERLKLKQIVLTQEAALTGGERPLLMTAATGGMGGPAPTPTMGGGEPPATLPGGFGPPGGAAGGAAAALLDADDTDEEDEEGGDE